MIASAYIYERISRPLQAAWRRGRFGAAAAPARSRPAPVRLMFVLDTNVLSAIMGSRPVPQVAAWIADQPEDLLFTAAICQAEILSGLAIMPEGRRRLALEASARAIFIEDFGGRVLPFDTEAATAYADIFAARKRAGRPSAPLDLMIAAVAHVKGASVVTRHPRFRGVRRPAYQSVAGLIIEGRALEVVM